ncbi:MAG: Omp28-related outer membrane protein [Candidatus Kapaibacterium sp.]
MKSLSLALLALLFTAAFSCCDIVTAPYREGVKVDTTQTDKPVQKVLLIDYTGYRCGNCPKGAEMAASLHETYGDKLIIVAMHTGRTFAEPDGTPEFTVDFRTPAGEQLYNDLGKPGQPTGTVNYVAVSGKRDIAYTGWGTEVQKQLAITPQMSIKLTPQFSTDSVLTLKADVKYITAGQGQRIVAYLVEDSIINAQEDYRLKTKPQIIPNYVQRHVFRGTIGGSDAFGEAIAATASGSTVSKTYTFDFKGSGFNARHCSVIVSINDAATKNTLQAEEVHIIK